MDPLRWGRIEAICADAAARPAAERGPLLDRACSEDAELRREIETLLDQIDRHPSFLERPLVDLGALPSPNDEPALTGSIGPYRLVRRLGRGGMGEVYLATRAAADIQQSVALKVIRRGLDTDEVLRRFGLERRILANLDHPNVARLLDASATDDGRPYFVMEYVEGVSITEFCDQRRLPIRERLTLFQAICAAVQHAHQHLVVHRDLKPTNILVTDAGVPKLLDFGIGKVLGPNDALGPAVDTATEARLLTPDYAAPEQVTGSPVTTATDVYALGVLLYELLAGHHPYRASHSNRRELERAILDANPSRPSEAVSRIDTRTTSDGTVEPITPDAISARRATDPGQLRRRLTGDLDNIVLMALRKEPPRRYPSAAALADDIQRHLDGLPVRARRDTFGYRTAKFVRRNAGAVAAAATAFVALIATTVVTLVQSGRVARESARVVHERDKALEVRGFLMEMFGATGADQAVGDTVTVRQLLDLQAARLTTAYGDRPDVKADMLEVLADGYDRLGLYQRAEPLAEAALDLRRRTSGPRHREVGSPLNLVGWIIHERGRSNEAVPLLQEAISIRRAAGAPERPELSRSLNDLGVVYNALGRYTEAESVLTESLAIRREAFGDKHRAVGITANNLAAAHYYRANLDQAVRVQALALDALRASVGPDHQRSVVALSNLAAFKRTLGDWRASESDYRDLLTRQTRLQGRDHPVTARVLGSLASVLYERGVSDSADAALAEAGALFREAVSIFETKLGPAHPQVGQTLERLAGVELAQGHNPSALAAAEKAVAILRAAYGDSNQATATSVARLAQVLWRMNRQDEALALQRRAIATLERAPGPSHPETAKAQAVLCDLLLSRHEHPEEAAELCSKAAGALAAAPSGYRRNLWFAELRLVRAHLVLGHESTADSILAAIRPRLDSARQFRAERRTLDSLTAILASRRVR